MKKNCTEENMASESARRFLALLSITKMQVKITMMYFYTSIQTGKVKTSEKIHARKAEEKLNLLHIVSSNVK